MNWFKLECTTRAFVTALQLTVRYEMSVIIIIIIMEITANLSHRVIPHDAMYSADYAVARCLSVTCRYSVETAQHIKLYSPSCRLHYFSFCVPNVMAIFRREVNP